MFELWLWIVCGGGFFGDDGFEDVDCVVASEGIFARSVGVGFIFRHDSRRRTKCP